MASPVVRWVIRRKSDGKFFLGPGTNPWRDREACWLDDINAVRPFKTRGGAIHSHGWKDRTFTDEFLAHLNDGGKPYDFKGKKTRKRTEEEMEVEVLPVEVVFRIK